MPSTLEVLTIVDAEGGALDRTRSAHDFGTAFAGGEEGTGVCTDSSGSFFSGSSVLVGASDTVFGSFSCSIVLLESDFEVMESRFRLRDGRFGIAGTTGTIFVAGRDAG